MNLAANLAFISAIFRETPAQQPQQESTSCHSLQYVKKWDYSTNKSQCSTTPVCQREKFYIVRDQKMTTTHSTPTKQTNSMKATHDESKLNIYNIYVSCSFKTHFYFLSIRYTWLYTCKILMQKDFSLNTVHSWTLSDVFFHTVLLPLQLLFFSSALLSVIQDKISKPQDNILQFLLANNSEQLRIFQQTSRNI